MKALSRRYKPETQPSHYLTHIEVVMTNAQRLPHAFFFLGERWTYLQSKIFRIARMTIDDLTIDQQQIAVFDELKDQQIILDYAIQIIRQ